MDEDKNLLDRLARHLLLDFRDGKSLAAIITSVFLRGGANEQILSFWALFGYCKDHYIDDLVLNISKVMESSSEIPTVKKLSFFLLYNILLTYEIQRLSSATISELKSTLLSSLKEQLSTPIFPVVARAVSILAYTVFALSPTNTAWPEYIDYVESLMDHQSEFRKGIWLVIDLPLTISEDEFMAYADKFKTKLVTFLDSHEDDEAWGLAFAACFNVMILLDEDDMAKTLMSIVKTSITELINQRKEVFLRKGLHILGFFTILKIWWYNQKTGGLIVDIANYILQKQGIELETAMAVNRVIQQMTAEVIAMQSKMDR